MSSEEIKELEEKVNGKIVYLTLSGSKLYGTNTPTSDTDIKGIFIPSNKSLLLGTAKSQYSTTTGSDKSRNTENDIDINLQSIHTFFKLLKKSETGAVDVLFSMFRNDTIIYQNIEFVTDIKQNYKIFLNSNMKSFIGYALGQTKKFGIKGVRYKELNDFVNNFRVNWSTDHTEPLNTKFGSIKEFLEAKDFKYIKFVQAPEPRGSGGYKDIMYISVLGKLFEGRVTGEYFYDRINKLHNQFGHRTISTAQTPSKTDYKALSHALRVAQEVKELLETKFIKFPLKDAQYIKEIKLGLHNQEKVIDKVRDVLDNVDALLLSTDILAECNSDKIDTLLLQILKK